MDRIHNTRQHSKGQVLYPLYVSEKKKKANDYALAKDFMDYYDMAGAISPTKIKRLQENYEIHSGRWPEIQNISPSLNINLGSENIVLGTGNLNHFPIADRVSKSVTSDLQIRPIIPVIRDNSSKARNFRERLRLERVKSFFYNTEIAPRIQKITEEYDAQNGVSNPMSLPEEIQKQRQFEIDQRFKQETPEEILSNMDKTRTDDELLADAIMQEGMRYTKTKMKLRTGSESAVVTGEEYYRLSIINGLPHVEHLNPKWVTWAGSENVIDCEDGQYATYTQYLTLEDAVTKYSNQLKGKDIKELSKLFSQIPGHGDTDRKNYTNDSIQRTLVKVFRDNPGLENEIDPRTIEGQNKLKTLYAQLGHNIRDGWGVKETYITWRWLRKVKFVKRLENGVVETYIRGEHYQMDPLAGDIEVEERAIPQVWEGTKLADEFYLDVRPIEFQYNDIENPFDVKLGIYGGKYNTVNNNVKNNSLIDMAKPWQYRYNVQMKKMEEHQATDIGKVFLGTTTMLPKGWTWAQWYRSLFVGKTAIVSTQKEGIGFQDAQIFKSIDMSRSVDIANDIKQLEYFEQKIISSMYYSPEKIGNVSEYATNQNTQIAIQGVDRQMYKFHERNRQIRENVLNGLLKLSFHAYKDNETVKARILSDFLKAHYELNFEYGDTSNFHVTLVDDFQESEKLNQMRQLALTFLQNGMTGGQLAALMEAESIPEMRQFLEEVDKKRAKQEEQDFKQQESLLEKQRQSAEMQLKLQQEFISMENERERQVKLRVAQIGALQMENAQDVDRNKVNDSLEKAILELEHKDRVANKQFEQDNKFKQIDKELEEKRLKIEEKKASKTK